MALAETTSLRDYCLEVAKNARCAASVLRGLRTSSKNDWLKRSADAVVQNTESILEANVLDLANAQGYGLDAAAMDRLRLDERRIGKIAEGLLQIAALPDPIGQLIQGEVLPSGLRLTKVRVPLGVVFFIYESRPNVTADAAAICVKSGNAVILRGGKEAANSSRAILNVLLSQMSSAGIPEHAVQLVATADRDAVDHFLALDQYIDVAIPRGGESLIRRVVQQARMPVIKHFDGNCHVYVDSHADIDMACNLILNSKTQRMGVCNACESLVIHRSIASQLLPKLDSLLESAGIEVRGDVDTCALIPRSVPATEQDYRQEYLGPIISIRVADDIQQAIDHINQYGSHHTDAIVTNNISSAEKFTIEVDSAAVMVNASTRFNDGGEFGLGAEIGISTDKFHARGPCGLKELTSYKYIVYGSGQVRN